MTARLHHNKIALALAAICGLLAHAQGHAQDAPETSASEKHLQEITVMADRGWVEDGKIVFLPSKSEKNLSNSPESLIKSMNLPMLDVEGNTIKSLTGKKVAIFINGRQADQNDIATFWPKLAKRVEYMENPEDPKYRGNEYVVNFVMTEYSAGGISKGYLNLETPMSGYASLASKLVYKKMTFGATLNGSLSKDDKTEINGKESYNNLYYGGDLHKNILRNYHEKITTKNRNLNAAVNARYTNGSFTATHTIALQFQKMPENNGWSADNWTPELFSGNNSFSSSRTKYFTPQIFGEYEAKLANKWFFYGEWAYAHSLNTNNSLNRLGETQAVTNGTREEVNRLIIKAAPVFRLNNKLIFHLNLIGQFDWFDTQYSGFSNQQTSMGRQEVFALLRTIWKPNSKLNITLLPGVKYTGWSTGKYNERLAKPTIYAALSWTPNSKSSLNWTLSFDDTPPSSSNTNPVLTRQSELLWLKGTPTLKNYSKLFTQISSTYLANRWLQFSAYAYYDHRANQHLFDYTPMPQQLGGLLKMPYNAGAEDQFQVFLRGKSFILNHSLIPSVALAYDFYRATGRFAATNHSFYLQASITYMLKNCSFYLSYARPREQMYDAGQGKVRSRDCCDFEFNYGNGNLLVSAVVNDIFNTRSKSITEFRSSNYDFIKNEYTTGRKFGVRLTYTFGYGKKVDRSIDISGPQSVDSSVLR